MAETDGILSQKLDELRQYGEELGLTENEINNCFLEILGLENSVSKKRGKISKKKPKRGCVGSTCRVIGFVFLVSVAIILALFIASSVDDHAALFVYHHVITPVAYPLLRVTRSVGIILNKLLDMDFIDYYETDCLVKNPFYSKEEESPDCSFCKEIKGVRLMSNISREVFKDEIADSGALIMVKDSTDTRASLSELQDVCQEGMHKIRAGFNQFSFPSNSSLKGSDGFFQDMNEKDILQEENFHAVWHGRRVGPGQVLRKYYPRPYFIKRKQEISMERKVYVDSPASGPYPIVPLSLHKSWYVQTWGTRTLKFTPVGNCSDECDSHSVVTSKGSLVYWDTIYWDVNSEPSPQQEDDIVAVSVSLLGAFE